MKPVYVSNTQAKAQLEKLITMARRGRIVIICRYGKPLVWLQPIFAKRSGIK
jgi:antitoxin (DNA-binding transcriptional repressor) of toxin-antitoxin stability system